MVDGCLVKSVAYLRDIRESDTRAIFRCDYRDRCKILLSVGLLRGTQHNVAPLRLNAPRRQIDGVIPHRSHDIIKSQSVLLEILFQYLDRNLVGPHRL